MRVLLVAGPLVGHVLPLVTLAHSFRAAGHEVLVGTAGDALAAVQRAGLPGHDVCPGIRIGRVMIGALLRHPLRMARMASGRDEGTAAVGGLFARVAAHTAAGTLALVDEWRPDLVVHEPLAGAGPLAAARAGVPAVLVDANLFDPVEQIRAVVAGLGPTARRHGLGPLPEPAAVVTTAPPTLVGARAGHPMRFVPPAGSGDVPEHLLEPSDRPRLLVSRSTAADPRPDRLMTRVVDAAAGAEVDVLLVRPDPAVLRRPLPPNVRTCGWISHAEALNHVDGIVHHGGAGTVLTALAAGTPQLVVPGAGDRSVNARLVAARGAGLAVPLDGLDSAALERLAGDGSLRIAAREVAAEIAAMPHPRQLVGPLTESAGQLSGG